MPPRQNPSDRISPPLHRRILTRRFRSVPDEADDRQVAGLLAYDALIEIRALARKRGRQPDTPVDEILQRISFLADLAHNLPLKARRRPFSSKPVSRRSEAMSARPMSWTWHTSGAAGQRWMSAHIAQAGYSWTPPPPLPTPRKGAGDWTFRQRLRVLAGWPVPTPPGQQRLPRSARVLKAVNRDQIHALAAESARRKLGTGSGGLAFRSHLDPAAMHYLFPDPRHSEWPSDERPAWQCRMLLRMIDGELIHSSLAVLPETFTALPATVPRMRQRRLALTAQMLERDYGLWSRDHEPTCSPEQCGFPASAPG